MKPYLLRNDNVQHAERLALERWYTERHGRRVPYGDILHELQAEKVRRIRRQNEIHADTDTVNRTAPQVVPGTSAQVGKSLAEADEDSPSPN